MRHASMNVRQQRWALWLCLGCLLTGCALLGKGKPLALRYFDLQPDAAAAEPSSQPGAPRLRLGSVSASRHIDRRFISRRGTHELSYYEEWRWTDQPSTFLRLMLAQNLFERAGLTRVVSGLAPTLEVELIAFEELKLPGRHRARVVVLALMHDDRTQLWQRSFDVELEVGAGDAAEALAEALGKALAQAANNITEQTLASLKSPSPMPSGARLAP